MASHAGSRLTALPASPHPCRQQKPLKCHYQALGQGVTEWVVLLLCFGGDLSYDLERSANTM